jgi:hypothetical protein
MTDANDRLQALEERIVALEAGLMEEKASRNQLRDFVVRLDVEHAISIKRLQLKLNEFFELLRMQKEWSTAESELLADTRTEMMKLTEVYYQVFPERLPQDVRVIEQLKAAKAKADPGAKKDD